MYEEVNVLIHSSIKITGERILYFDPFNILKKTHDADIILVTHEHYDHYSPKDIEKVKNDSTIFVCPESMREKIDQSPSSIAMDKINYLSPGEDVTIGDIKIHAVPAYNVGKDFHQEEYHWLGYVVYMGETCYYVAGDTDINKDVIKVRDLHPDVALVPCGGTFTMNVDEAVSLIKEISPKLAIPTHYGTIVGDRKDGDRFVALLSGAVSAQTRIRF